MQTSTVVWIVVLAIVVIGGIWWWMSANNAANTAPTYPAGVTTGTTSTSTY